MGQTGQGGAGLAPDSGGNCQHNPLGLSPTSLVRGAQPAQGAQQMKSEPSRQIPRKMDGG